MAVICAWSVCCSARRKNTFTLAVLTGPPLVWMLSAPTFDSASSAVSICARGRVVGERRRRLAVEGQRERAARRVGGADGLLLVGHLVVERAEAAGVDAAGRRVVTRDEPQVVVLVEVDVARDVAALLAVVGDPQDLLLGAEVQVRGPLASSTNLKRESWK